MSLVVTLSCVLGCVEKMHRLQTAAKNRSAKKARGRIEIYMVWKRSACRGGVTIHTYIYIYTYIHICIYIYT